MSNKRNFLAVRAILHVFAAETQAVIDGFKEDPERAKLLEPVITAMEGVVSAAEELAGKPDEYWELDEA